MAIWRVFRCSSRLPNVGVVVRLLSVDQVQPLRGHEEELPARREVPQDEAVRPTVGAVQLRVELGDAM